MVGAKLTRRGCGAGRLAHPRDPLWFGLAVTSGAQEVDNGVAALGLGDLEVAAAALAHADAQAGGEGAVLFARLGIGWKRSPRESCS